MLFYRFCFGTHCFFFSSRRRHTRFSRDWSSGVCSSDLGVEMQNFRAYAGIAGAPQDAVGAAADRIGQRRIAEGKLVIAVGVVLVLARIAASLRELPVDAGAARPGDDGKD